jgi:ABC-type transport system substrate-binding protein
MKRGAFLTILGAAALPRSALALRPFRVGVYTFATTLDPFAGAAPEIDDYAWIYGDGLTGGEAVPSPMLADVPETRERGLTIRYRLRTVRWHDGVTLRAAHVAATVERLRHPSVPGGQPSPWSTFEPYALIRDYTVRGSDTFEVRLYRAHPEFTRTFFSPYGHPALPLLRHDADGHPIGTGPFRLRHADAERWRFSAWTGSPRGSPMSAELDVRFRPSRDELKNEIAAGYVDLAIPLPVEEAKTDRYYIAARDSSTVVLIFNCEGAFNSTGSRLDVLRALDLNALQRTINPQAKARVSSLLPEGAPDDVAFPFPERDVAAARSGLKSIRAPVTMMYPSESERYATLALQIRQMLGAAGVDVVMVPRPHMVYFAPEGPLRMGRFDMTIYGFAYRNHPDLAADWSCANRAPAGANYARLCDRQFDDAFAAGRERDALKLLLRDAAVVPLARNVERFGVGTRVAGFDAPPVFVPPTIAAQRWVVPGETG